MSENYSMERRLSDLLDVVQRVAAGDFSVQAKKEKDDLIGMLAVGINMMIVDLEEKVLSEKNLAVAAATSEAEKKRANELDALNQQLRASEQQLKAANQQLRASEQQLKASNQQLTAKEQALKASQETLKTKISDLERFNKIMVGRELEMIKLKEEVNSLLAALGKEIKYKVAEKINRG